MNDDNYGYCWDCGDLIQGTGYCDDYIAAHPEDFKPDPVREESCKCGTLVWNKGDLCAWCGLAERLAAS